MLSTLATFLDFYKETVRIQKINDIYWFCFKTEDFTAHKEYSNLEKGSAEFIEIAIQTFCQKTEKNILVAEISPTFKIVFTTRKSNFTFSRDFTKSYEGYSFKDLCENHDDFQRWQADLEYFGWAERPLNTITPDGKYFGRESFYAEKIPNTNLYFCTIAPTPKNDEKVFISNDCFYYVRRPKTLKNIIEDLMTIELKR